MGKEVVVSRNPFFISFLCCGSEAVKCTVIKILLNRSNSVVAVLESASLCEIQLVEKKRKVLSILNFHDSFFYNRHY